MKAYLYIIILLTITMLSSCNDNDDDSATLSNDLVVEGWIANDDYPIVMLSSMVPVSKKDQKINSLYEYVQHWAKVTISDGTQEVVLMGKYDKSFMPPYIYTTTDMKGRVGGTYKLTVTIKGDTATAVTTIPQPVKFDSILSKPSPKQPFQREFQVAFNNDGAERNYALFYMVGRRTQQLTVSTYGVFDNTSIDTGTVRYPVYFSNNLIESRDSALFKTRPQYVCFRLAVIDRTSYNFWSDFMNTYTMSDKFLMPYTNKIRSNIWGGYGYWCGMGVSDRWVEIDDR